MRSPPLSLVPDPLERWLQALMTLPVAPAGASLEDQRAWCAALRAVADRLDDGSGPALPMLERLRAPPGGLPFPNRQAALRALLAPASGADAAALTQVWAAVAEAEARGDDVALEQALRRVLLAAPNDPQAHGELARLYRRRSEAGADAERWRALCGWHDAGEHEAWLRGDASLTVATSAPARCVAEGPDGVVDLGPTPVAAGGLAPGTWRLRFDGEAGAASTWVQLGRGAAVAFERPVRLLARRPAGFVHVPAGPFYCGGDDQADYPLPGSVRDLSGFLIAELPVTLGEYVAFLNARYVDDPDDALHRVPRRPVGDGHRALLPTRRDRPQPFEAPPGGLDRQPVVGIARDDALAYAAWASARDGVTYRLPTELEWEKAARGVDGRHWPWGDAFDASRCNMRHTGSRPSVLPVGAIPGDLSPFGMRDAAGNVLEWCAPADGVEVPAGGVPVRGGSWHSSPQACRVADRFGVGPWYVDPSLGFRLAMDEDEAARS